MDELLEAIANGRDAMSIREIIQRLKAAGTDLNETDPDRINPAHLATLRDLPSVITDLGAARADLDLAGGYGCTPAQLAAHLGHADSIAALHAAGANLNAVSSDGLTPAHLAVQNRQMEALTALGAAGADLDAVNRDGWTPAHLAALDDHAGMISALHAAGADLSATGPKGKTPAHLAAEHGNAKAITALQEAGADLNATDVQGRTPIDVARHHGHTPVVNALLLQNQRRLMTAVVEALGGSDDTSARNLAIDLKCPVMLEAYTAHGETRPVRLPDGAVNAETGRFAPGSVLSAFAARHCMRPDLDGDLGRPPPTDPLNRNHFTEVDAEAYLASDAFLLGDTARVALVSAVWEACERTDGTPAAIIAAATTAAATAGPAGPVAASADAAVPQYQVILDARAARTASGPRGGAAGPRRDQGGPAI